MDMKYQSLKVVLKTELMEKIGILGILLARTAYRKN